MERTRSGGADELLTRVSSSLTRWVLGLGLLSLHATTYTIAMVGMVLWNIYDSPNNLWVDEVFYRWTAVLAFHAIAVVCGWTAYRLMRSEQAAVIAAQREWTPVQTTAAPAHQPYQLQAPTAVWRPMDAAPPDPATARRGAISNSAAWSTAFARRTVGAMSGATNRLTHRNANTPAPPAQTWPESPTRLRSDEEEFVSRFTAPATAAPPPPAPPVETDTVVTVASHDADPSPPAPTKDPGQSWVEAATSAWHGPSESPDARQNGRLADESTDSPAQ